MHGFWWSKGRWWLFAMWSLCRCWDNWLHAHTWCLYQLWPQFFLERRLATSNEPKFSRHLMLSWFPSLVVMCNNSLFPCRLRWVALFQSSVSWFRGCKKKILTVFLSFLQSDEVWQRIFGQATLRCRQPTRAESFSWCLARTWQRLKESKTSRPCFGWQRKKIRDEGRICVRNLITFCSVWFFRYF